MYSENEIQCWFEEIRDKSYSDLCLSSKVFMKDMEVTGYSSPFNGNVYINLSLINKHKLNKDAVFGVLAHELAHQVSYRKRSFFSKWFFLWNYYLSLKKRSEVEKEADEITVQRGYGKELLEERKSQNKRYSDDKEKLKLVKKVYLSKEEVEELLKNISK